MSRTVGRRREPTPEERKQRRRRALLLPIATLIAIELILRVLMGNFAQSRMLQRSEHPDVCLENQPGIDLTYTGWLLRTPPSRMRTNALGGRGPEVGAKTKLRVVALGDSFTFGQGVEEDEAFVQVAARSLAGQGLDVEMLNFGVPGHGQPQAVALLEHRLLELDPDVVLLNVFANDLSAEDSYCQRGRGTNPLGRQVLLNVYTARLFYVLASPLRRAAPPSNVAALGTPEERYSRAITKAAELGAEHDFAVGVVLLTDRATHQDTRFCPDCTPPHDLRTDPRAFVIDLSDLWVQLQSDIPAHFIRGDDHLNAAGNDKMGEALGAALAPHVRAARD